MFGEDANAYTQVTLNLSHQTESADLIGGFRPVDARIPGSELQARFIELFGATFSRKKNEKFETEVRKAVAEGRWKRAAGLWKESVRLARDRIRKRREEEQGETRCFLLAVGFCFGHTHVPYMRYYYHSSGENGSTREEKTFVVSQTQ